jgi:hypothetical protein
LSKAEPTDLHRLRKDLGLVKVAAAARRSQLRRAVRGLADALRRELQL